MNKPIDRAIAKQQLERINGALREPHLLIGGLAVQQFHTARDSKDIDLVCEFETARQLIDTLYRSRDWDVQEEHEDDYRPSFRISHKVQDLGTIIFGPKICERAPYDHIDWGTLRQGSMPFRSASGALQNILVPAAHSLAYTKFISFLGRKSSDEKVRADLRDFVDLTNNHDFCVSQFYCLLRKTGAFEQLLTAFREKCVSFHALLEESCLHAILTMFSPPARLGLNASPTAFPVDVTSPIEPTGGAVRPPESPGSLKSLTEPTDEYVPGDWTTIGRRVHYVMYIRDIRPSALDGVLEKEQGYTNRLLKTARHPKADTMSRLSKALGVPICFLVEGQSNLFLCRDLQTVAMAVRRLRHKVRAPLGDLLARSLFDFPFIKSSSDPIEPELSGLAPLDVLSMGTLAVLVGANPPTPEQDLKAIKVAFTITAKALENIAVPGDRLSPELGSAWLEAMPEALGTDKSRPIQEITAQSLLLSARRYEEASGTPPPLRIFPTWWMAAQEAKRHLPGVPPEYIDTVGDLRIHLDCDPDWQLVGDLARGLHDAALRGRVDDSALAQQAVAADGASRRG